jgi:hypothetical protein
MWFKILYRPEVRIQKILKTKTTVIKTLCQKTQKTITMYFKKKTRVA